MIRRATRRWSPTRSCSVCCPEGAGIVESTVAANEFDTEGILVNPNALMEAGKQTTDGRGIDHLPGWFPESIGTAFGTCFAG